MNITLIEFTLTTLIVVAFFVGYVTGWKKYEKHFSDNLKEFLEETIIDLRHEVIDNIHYLYNNETDEFVAQASTLEEVARIFSLNGHNDHIGKIESKTGTYFIIDGKLEKVLEE